MPIASALRSVLRLLGVALVALISPALTTLTASTAADGFNPNVDGNVYAVAVQPDGKVLIAGKFNVPQPGGVAAPAPRRNIARVLPDGSDDASFNATVADVDGQIDAMVLQPDGRIVIGGKFTHVGGTARNHAARLNADGSLDPTFDPNTGGSVTGVAGIDTAEVSALALQADGGILIGGGFGTVQPNGASGATPRNGLARFNADGTLDANFNPNLDGMVLAIAVQPADQEILIGGGFKSVGGGATVRNRIARLHPNGMVDQNFDPNANNAVSAIVVQPDGRVIVGGSFTTLQPNGSATASSRLRLTRLTANGNLDTYAGYADGPVAALKLQADGRLLVGGSFGTLDTTFSNYCGRLLADGEADIFFTPGPNFAVYAFGEQADGSVVLGGAFTTLRGTGVTSVVRNHVARVSPVGGLDTDFRPDVNGRLESLAVQSDGKILATGTFTSVGGVTRNGLVRLNADGTLDASFTASANGFVAVAVPQADGTILIGGGFTSVNSTQRFYIARLKSDGSLDPGFGGATNGNVTAIAIQGDKILIGGAFTQLAPFSTSQPITRVSLARLNADGSLDNSFGAQAYQGVSTILVQPDSKIILGGAFTSVQGTGATTQTSRYHLARLNADGTVDTAFNGAVNSSILTGALQPDGKIVLAGNFTQAVPASAVAGAVAVVRNNILRMNADGTIDSTFDPEANGVVLAVALLSNGQIVVGGKFTSLQPNVGTAFTRNYVARLNADGTVDPKFDLQLDTLPGNMVVAVAKAGSDRLIVGGAFTSLLSGSVSRNRIAQIKLNSDGSVAVDQAFNADLSTGPGANVEALAQQSDGGVFVAGTFSTLNGTGSTNLALFNADSTPNTSFFPNINGTVHSVAQLTNKGGAVPTQRSGFAWLENNGQLRANIPTGGDPVAFRDIRAFAVQADGKIVVSASVTRLGSNPNDSTTNQIDYLVRFNPDGSLDSAFKPLVNGTVLVIRIQPTDQKILIGGQFSTVGLSSKNIRNNMARLNPGGDLDPSFDPNFDGGITEIVVQPDNKILVGGTFTKLSPNATTTTTPTLRSNLVRLNADSTVDTTFDPSPNSTVRSIVLLPGGGMLVGGLFTVFEHLSSTGTPVGTVANRTYLARVNADGSVDSTDFAVNGQVTQLVTQADGKIIVSGSFSTIEGQSRNYLARLNADATLTVDSAFDPNPSDVVNSVSIQPADGKILLGGNFTALQQGDSTYDVSKATPRHYSARLDVGGKLDSSFNPNFNSALGNILAYPDGSIIAGGTFTTIQPTGSLLVGGAFDKISGVGVNNLALFSGDGSVSSTFQPNPDGPVYALQAMAGGQVVVAGGFQNIAGASRNGVARFLADSSLDSSFDPNVKGGAVLAVALQPDGKMLLGGRFATVGGATHNNLARINADGSVDGSFAPAVSGAVSAIAVQPDGRMLVLSAGSGVSSTVVRLAADGSADGSFAPVTGGSAAINALALQTDGKIVIGGAFAGLTRGALTSPNYLARLNADGTLDSTLASAPNGPVTALMIAPDGKIVIGGFFNSVDGLPRFGLARIGPTAPVPVWFAGNLERTTLTWMRSGPGPEVSSVLFSGSTDGVNWTTLGPAQRVPGTTNWSLSGLSLPGGSLYYVRAFGVMPGSSQGSSGLMESRGTLYLAAVPVIMNATTVGGTQGSSFLYAIVATGGPKYAASGLPAGLTLNSTGQINGTPTQTGTFSVTLTATNSAGSTSAVLTIVVAASGGGTTTTAGRLVNLSVLAPVTNANPIIAGFVVSGTGAQTLLIRAVGPNLAAQGVTGVLASPHLKLFDSTGRKLSESDAWGGSSDLTSVFTRLGAYPFSDPNSADVALMVTLQPGPYTVTVTDNGTAGGYALAEVYDASFSPPPVAAPRLVNLSARGMVSGGQLVSGGFVISGTTSKKILIRGVGPGLGQFGVPGVLADPTLTLVRASDGAVLAQNDNWGTPVTANPNYPPASAADVSTAAAATGAFPFATGSTDSAILITLPPGLYTPQVGGVAGATGAAMVEVYEVP